jgi:hypothetical protein
MQENVVLLGSNTLPRRYGGFEIFNMKVFHKKLRCLPWPKKLEKLPNDCPN